MPRRSRAREYDEEDMYEAERDVYPRRGRDDRFFEEDIRYKRRGPDAPPTEKLERLHLQAQRGPEILREFQDYPPELAPPSMRREPEFLDPLPRERPRGYERNRDEVISRRGRPRSRELDMEEEVVFRDETDRRYTDSESDKDIVVVPKKDRSVYRRKYEIPKEPKPRSRSLLEEKMVRESDYEQDSLLLPKDPAKADHRRHRSGPFYETSSRSRHKHRSHRHRSIDEADDELDEEVDKEKLLTREARKRRPARIVEEDIFERRERSSSPEVAIPRVPSPVQVLPVHERHVHESRRKVYPPRAPSPEIVLTEAEIRQRERGRKGRSDNEEILIVKREDEEDFPPSRRPSADPYRREKPVPIDPPRPRPLEREKDKLTIIRRDGSRESLVEEEFDEEEVYRSRGHDFPPRKEMKATEELKIVTTPPRDKSSTRTEIVTQEIKPSRYTDRESKLVTKDVKESDDIPDRQPGRIGRRYVGIKDRRESLWTEITKDLVVKEALERSGYEYEETGSFYYIFSYLEQEDVDALIELSEDIRRARRRRIQEIHRERASMPLGPPPLMATADKTGPLLLDHPAGPPRFVRDERRKKERDVVVEGNRWRPPPRSERW
ncbi:hypothetical protein BO94DRAFT_580272 [Aspergillus sclerotioniger CBS 115572]|uniref:DUF8035 domain-containing protein n=1 Tax=Aspergillus sclerotioniger CBS 115572 TaxID=1450535 RepID=A0A317XCT2_9EURO|nr:hypothetical protein BO94DRAFT_580272 [Aspergillus sclerotioniger CBS 115572]PWY96424.1 hypothetical protein BO94DRAFT_580272 [Aspergillus sclerotioniger CBS 115572]